MGLLSFCQDDDTEPLPMVESQKYWVSSAGRVSGRATTGRDRAINVSWIAVAMGILSASYFFYRVGADSLSANLFQRIGNNIVDTQLPGDDEDLKPPPGWKFEKQLSYSPSFRGQKPRLGRLRMISSTDLRAADKPTRRGD